MSDPDQEAPAKGGFFAIDRRTWARLCVPSMMNEAVAYLVQARGTGRDNRTTAWSIQAVETYTEISRRRAAAAIQNLQTKGFTRLVRGGSKPKYELIPHTAPERRDPLSQLEQHAVDLVADGEELSSASERQAAYRAVTKGWLARDGNGGFAIRPEPKPDVDWIWLPNELVTGAACATPPLELVRQTQEPMTLRLLVDMYHAQNLREDGGVLRRAVWREYHRDKVGDRAEFAIWGFRRGDEWVSWDNQLTSPHRREELTKEEKAAGKNEGVDFFRRIGQLTGLGLIEWVPHLVESGDASGEIIHALGIGGTASVEDCLGQAAREAARTLISGAQYDRAVENGIEPLVPVLRHIANVQVVGIARLRYRPHTRLTAAWWADLQANADKHLARYTQIASQQITRLAV
jgi:hypothetical protein